ncbi:MAG: TauD/TfdA family dioxygenase [Pseudomonadota bacterium]
MNVSTDKHLLNARITGPSCWTGPDLKNRDDWHYVLTQTEADELETAARATADRPVLDITADEFPLPSLGPKLAEARTQALYGTGISLLRGVPVIDRDENTAARILWGLGQHIGIPQPQDASGALLHHVRDTGASVAGNSNIRTYETREAQPWHNDGGDLFMLLCRQVSTSGGGSYVASAHTVFNALLERNPELVETLQRDFFFDARGQALPGCGPVQQVPIYTWFRDRLMILHKRHYIEHAQRFPEVPRLTEGQIAALDAFDEICERDDIHLSFQLEPGDVQIGHNFSVLHKRGAFDQSGEGPSRRHLLRLWLGLPDGWPLPETYRLTREFGPLFQVREMAA